MELSSQFSQIDNSEHRELIRNNFARIHFGMSCNYQTDTYLLTGEVGNDKSKMCLTVHDDRYVGLTLDCWMYSRLQEQVGQTFRDCLKQVCSLCGGGLILLKSDIEVLPKSFIHSLLGIVPHSLRGQTIVLETVMLISS